MKTFENYVDIKLLHNRGLMIHKPRQRLQTLAVVLVKNFFLEAFLGWNFNFLLRAFI